MNSHRKLIPDETNIKGEIQNTLGKNMRFLLS